MTSTAHPPADDPASVTSAASLLNRTLIRKYVGASALLFAGCGITLFSFAWVRVWVVSLLDMSQFQTVLDQFREYERFAPINFDALISYAGRVGMTFDEPVVIFCTVVWCVSRGSDVVAGELGRGTLEMILAQPIRRTTVLLSHALVSVVGLAMLCLLVWAGIAIGVELTSVDEAVPSPTYTIPFLNFDVSLGAPSGETVNVPLSDRVDTRIYLPAVLNLFAFGFFLLGLSTYFSSRDRYRWRAIGIVIAIYVVQIVMFGLGKAAASLAWLLPLTFFNCYKPQPMTAEVGREGLAAGLSWTRPLADDLSPPMIYVSILIVGGLLFYALAIRTFARRDLPAPL